MHQPFRHSIAIVEDAGRQARKGKSSRSDNPFENSMPREVSMITPELRALLVNAWWRGWDDEDAREPK